MTFDPKLLSCVPVATPADNYLFAAVMRCGDNDNDPLGYFEYSVDSVSGGQVSWGVNANLELDTGTQGKTFTLALKQTTLPKGAALSVQSGNSLLDTGASWDRITSIVIQAHVGAATNPNLVSIGTTHINGSPFSCSVFAPTMLDTSAGKEGREPEAHGEIKALTNSMRIDVPNLRDLTIQGQVAMRGPQAYSRNLLIARVLVYGSPAPAVAGHDSVSIVPPLRIADKLPPGRRSHGKSGCE